MKRSLRGKFHPADWRASPLHTLVLNAALGDGDEAVAAWRELKRLTTLDDLDAPAGGLLPLVYRNLTRLGADDPDLGRLKGTYRFNWSRNQLLLKTAENAIATLQAAGIETIVLKGMALSLREYGDLGLRQMTDVDILVPRRRALEALRALQPRFTVAVRDPELRVEVHHSTALRDEYGREVDLHWYSLWQSAPDDDLWSAATPLTVGAVQSRAPCPADQLLILCSHGAWSWTPPGAAVRWIADATVLMRSAGGDLDWDRLVDQAVRRRLNADLAEPLAYLREAFGAPVPAGTISDLRSVPQPEFGGLGPIPLHRSRGPARYLSMHADRYHRLQELDPGAPRRPSFRSQVWGSFGSRSLRELLVKVARRLLGRR